MAYCWWADVGTVFMFTDILFNSSSDELTIDLPRVSSIYNPTPWLRYAQ